MKKRVAVIANNDIGLFNFRREVIASLIQEGYDVNILLPYGDRVKELVDMGCEYYKLSMERRGKNPFKDFALFLNIRKLLLTIKPDVVLTYTIKPNIYGGMASKSLHIPYMANITGLGTAIENKGLTSSFITKLYKVALNRAKCVFFQNAENMKFMQECGIGQQNAVLLPGSGVNLEYHCFEKYPENKDELSFLFVGRLMQDKGVGELIEAAKILKKDYHNIKFKVVGGCEEGYKGELVKREADKYVELCGHQSEVHKYMKEAHAVVLPSYHEGMANVLLEAAACGRPVIASNIPGCRESFDENISGYGFRARDVDDLVRVLKKFIELDYSQKEAMGLAGRKKVEQEFDRKIVVEAYKKEIEALEER